MQGPIPEGRLAKRRWEYCRGGENRAARGIGLEVCDTVDDIVWLAGWAARLNPVKVSPRKRVCVPTTVYYWRCTTGRYTIGY